jgi:hypothetical protein
MIQPTWDSSETSHGVLGSPASLAADVLVGPRRCLAGLGILVLQAFLARTAGALTAAGLGRLPSYPDLSSESGSKLLG